MTQLECGDNIVISAVPRKTISRERTKLIAYYCFIHRDYFPKATDTTQQDEFRKSMNRFVKVPSNE